MVDADTGENKRLAPRKATVVPDDGCQIYFGAVLCKVGSSLVDVSIVDELGSSNGFQNPALNSSYRDGCVKCVMAS